MLFLDHESDSYRSSSILKLWLNVTLFWRFVVKVASILKSQGIE